MVEIIIRQAKSSGHFNCAPNVFFSSIIKTICLSQTI